MAQVDVQWPSEDEDFDAVTDSQTVNEIKNGQNSPEPKPASEPETEPEVEPQSSPEPDSPEPEKVEEPEPVSQSKLGEEAPVAAAAVTSRPPKQAFKGLGSIGRLVAEAALVIVILALGFMNLNLSNDKQDVEAKLAAAEANPQALVQKQTDELIGKVRALINLPEGESPTVASVSDVNAARQQSDFFKNAQNGDKVLMYVKAGQAILYRPSTNKIILVAPLTFNDAATAASQSTSNNTKPNTTTR